MTEDNKEDKKKKYEKNEHDDVTLVRVLGKDIRGDVKLKSALTKIKGISWAFSNAVCKVLKIDKNKIIGSLSENEIKK